ncbi:unnamed protein product [Lactuca saligna]|uniref:PB1-like domain-containing protein n=1 Tax=Lactuca saligna TaxID=75948 RepID=A0AA35YPH4_LACSI|nr:unnamed protein product [Lactuca saligna]
MVLTLWSLRPRYTQLPDLCKAYGSISSFCTFKINHGGSFTNMVSGRSYIDGLVDHFGFVDIDVFSVHELDDMMEVLGYNDGGDEHQPKGDVDPMDDYEVMWDVDAEYGGGKNLHNVEFFEDEYIGSKESVSEGPGSEGSRSEGNMIDDESEDEDFFVDLENIVDDVDVDMKEFHIHVDEYVEWVQKTTKEKW